MTTPNSRIEICGTSNCVQREKPRALKPYMTDETWEQFCDDLDDAMKPWVMLTKTSFRIARALGGLFLVFAIAYTSLKIFNETADEANIAAYVLFPVLMVFVTVATCWLLRVVPKTNELVVEQIEGVLEGATQQINQKVQHTTVSMKYIEDERHNKKWIQVRIVNENGEVLAGDELEDDLSENGGSFSLV